MGGLRSVELIGESIINIDNIEAWKHDLDWLFEGLAGTGTEVIVDCVTGTFSNTSERVLPDELLGHAHNYGGLGFSHRLRAKAVRNLQDTERTHAKLIALKQHAEDLGVAWFESHLNLRWFLERILEDKHARSAIANSSWNWLRLHDGWHKTFTFNIVFPLANMWVWEHDISALNLVQSGWWVLNLDLDGLVGR